MSSALIVGGTGPIGHAAGVRLAETGWEVVVASRSGELSRDLAARGVAACRVDRGTGRQLEQAIADGVDLLVDVVAFTEEDAAQLNALADRLGSVVVISSASVYVDDRGRTFDEATSVDTFPDLPVPIGEGRPTVAPAGTTYSTRKVALENALLEGPLQATLIRPGAIHGPGASLPRELFFVKRVLDGRRAVVLVDNGESLFHTTSAANLAELIRLAAVRPGTRVLNCGDPQPPTTREICCAIGAALGHRFEKVLIPQTGYDRPDLSNPWAVPRPFVLDMTRAEQELGYRPVTTYGEAVAETCAWLASAAAQRDWSDTYLGRYFDYSAEDAVIAAATERAGDRQSERLA